MYVSKIASRNIKLLIKRLSPIIVYSIGEGIELRVYVFRPDNIMVIAKCNFSEETYRVKKYDRLSNLKINVLEYMVLCNNYLLYKVFWDKERYKVAIIKNPYTLILRIASEIITNIADIVKMW